MKVCIINGPNLNLLEKRETDIYGGKSFNTILENLKTEFNDVEFDYYQSNNESDLCLFLNNLDNSYNGIIINPGAFTHNSIALRDSISMLKIPVIEVHLSNITNRENFRKINVTTSKTIGYISGFKEYSYYAACYLLKKIINNKG